MTDKHPKLEMLLSEIDNKPRYVASYLIAQSDFEQLNLELEPYFLQLQIENVPDEVSYECRLILTIKINEFEDSSRMKVYLSAKQKIEFLEQVVKESATFNIKLYKEHSILTCELSKINRHPYKFIFNHIKKYFKV